MFGALSGGTPEWDKLRTIVGEEERAIGWSYLAGSTGADAESAFQALRSLLREE
jgi:hypothetical protein